MADLSEPGDHIAQILLMDCVVTLIAQYQGKLGEKNGKPIPFISQTFDRKIIKQQYTLATLIDDELKDFCRSSKAKGLWAKSKALVITNHSEIKRWKPKVQCLVMLLLAIDHKAIIEDKTAHSCISALVKSKLSTSARLTYMFQYEKLTKEKAVTYLVKSVINAIKKHDTKKYSSVLKAGSFSTNDIEKLEKATAPRKKVSGKITQKTHPNYYTLEKPYELLNLPIPEDAKPTFAKNLKDGRKRQWYATWEDPISSDWKTAYLVKDRKRNDEKKWEIVKDFMKGYTGVKKAIREKLGSKDHDTQVKALMLGLIQLGSFRIGSTATENDGVRGLGTLLVKHITVDGKSVKFDYIAKKKKADSIVIKLTDQALVILKRCLKGKGKKDYVFTNKRGNRITEDVINKFLKDDIGAPEGVSAHKFRHVNASLFARKALKNPPFDSTTTLAQKKAWYKKQIEKVKDYLRHDAANTTKKSYIEPSIMEAFEKKWGLRPEDLLKGKIKKVKEMIAKKRALIRKAKEGKVTAKKKERIVKLKEDITKQKEKLLKLKEEADE